MSETFKAAHDRILRELGGMGWTLSSPDLKVRHATSPDGYARIWFKAQAVYHSQGSHTFGLARSLHCEVRAGVPGARTTATLIMIAVQS